MEGCAGGGMLLPSVTLSQNHRMIHVKKKNASGRHVFVSLQPEKDGFRCPSFVCLRGGLKHFYDAGQSGLCRRVDFGWQVSLPRTLPQVLVIVAAGRARRSISRGRRRCRDGC